MKSKVYCRAHKNQPIVRIVRQINPVHALPELCTAFASTWESRQGSTAGGTKWQHYPVSYFWLLICNSFSVKGQRSAMKNTNSVKSGRRSQPGRRVCYCLKGTNVYKFSVIEKGGFWLLFILSVEGYYCIWSHTHPPHTHTHTHHTHTHTHTDGFSSQTISSKHTMFQFAVLISLLTFSPHEQSQIWPWSRPLTMKTLNFCYHLKGFNVHVYFTD
jgi:hypothetical protein